LGNPVPVKSGITMKKNLSSILKAAMYIFLFLFIISGSKIFCQDAKRKTEEKTFRINSQPEGAKVLLNGKEEGTTPLEKKELKKGSYTIVLIDQNGKKTEQTVDYDGGKKELFYILDGEYGLIDINTEPKGAKVKINNKDYGVTPLADIKLNAGINKFIFEKEDYETLAKTVYITKTKQKTAPELKYLYSFISVNDLNSATEKAILEIDGEKKEYSGNTPFKLPYGEHNIKIKASNYHKPMEASLYLESKKNNELTFQYNTFTLKNVLYSAVFPGAGQYLDNSKLKGLCFGAAAAANILIIILNEKDYKQKVDEFHESYSKYQKSVMEDDIIKYKIQVKNLENKIDDIKKKRTLFCAALAGIYTLNLIDAFVFHTKGYEIHLIPRPETSLTGLDLLQFKIKL
jgi:hypothetical protein